jgi:hypothetical protein
MHQFTAPAKIDTIVKRIRNENAAVAIVSDAGKRPINIKPITTILITFLNVRYAVNKRSGLVFGDETATRENSRLCSAWTFWYVLSLYIDAYTNN